MSLDFYLKYEVEPGEFVTVFDGNITHNVTKMADEAGIYKELWRPSDVGAIKAKDIYSKLKIGFDDLMNKPSYYKEFEAKNGWGTYFNFVGFVGGVLDAVERYPNAIIEVDR